MTAEPQNEYYLVTKDELWNIRNDCQHPESDSCDGCELWKDDDCTFIGANILIEDVVLKRPYKSSDMLDVIKKLKDLEGEYTRKMMDTHKENLRDEFGGRAKAYAEAWNMLKELRTKER